MTEARAGRDQALRQTNSDAEQRSEAADIQVTAMRDELDRLERDRAAAEAMADKANQRAQEAQDIANSLRQTEAVRQARGRWARLRAAWRGE